MENNASPGIFTDIQFCLFGVYASVGYAPIQNSIKMILKLVGKALRDKTPTFL